LSKEEIIMNNLSISATGRLVKCGTQDYRRHTSKFKIQNGTITVTNKQELQILKEELIKKDKIITSLKGRVSNLEAENNKLKEKNKISILKTGNNKLKRKNLEKEESGQPKKIKIEHNLKSANENLMNIGFLLN
jgi:hypothetical protein